MTTDEQRGNAADDETVVGGVAAPQTWDEFWQEVERKEAEAAGTLPTTVIRGVEVPIPHDLPLRFQRKLEAVEHSESDDDVRALLVDLFGADTLDQWIDAGMKGLELRCVLLWAVAHGNGRPITFAEALEAVRTEGKSLAPVANRTQKRASARSGGRSKPTSPASTDSKRKTSQR